LLSLIFHACDSKGLQLVATWVPREQNLTADFLSHLSASLCRPSVSGTLARGDIFFAPAASDGE
jgi:hypothetical protein